MNKYKTHLMIVAVFIFGVLVGGGFVAKYGSPINLDGQQSSAKRLSCAQIQAWLSTHPATHPEYEIYRRWWIAQHCGDGPFGDVW